MSHSTPFPPGAAHGSGPLMSSVISAQVMHFLQRQRWR